MKTAISRMLDNERPVERRQGGGREAREQAHLYRREEEHRGDDEVEERLDDQAGGQRWIRSSPRFGVG